MGLMGLVCDLLWICGAASLLFYLFHEIKKSQIKLGSFNCQKHLSLPVETWLVLAVITNASGWIIFWSRFLDFPYSWFTAVVSINIFRLLFRITPTMPIILDLGVSMMLQWLLSWGHFGWKWAFLLVFTVVAMVFYKGYFVTMLDEYKHLMQENPDARQLLEFVSPLSPLLLGVSLADIYFINGCLLLIAWFYPWNDGFYRFCQDSVGFVLMKESIIFLTCYNDLFSNREGLRIPKGETGKKKPLSKKSRENLL